MVTTMREQEVFLLEPGQQPDDPHKHTAHSSFILVVEDDAPTLRLERVILEEEGYAVEVVGSGEQALDFLSQKTPCLVLLDIGLPGMDGFTACAKIREISSVPIIMVTGRDNLDDKVKGMDVGADDYVTKPFLTHELATRVKVVLRRTSVASNEAQYLEEVSQDIPPAPPQPIGQSVDDPEPEAAEELAAANPPAPAPKPAAAPPKPVASGESYEGTVRLTVSTLGPVRNLINFVSELRQGSQFRLLRLVANQHKEGMDIWLGLREPLKLVEILSAMGGVHEVAPGVHPDPENHEQLIIVTLD